MSGRGGCCEGEELEQTMTTHGIRGLWIGPLLVLAIACRPVDLATPIEPPQGPAVPVLAALVAIDLTEDLLMTEGGSDCAWTWNLRLEVLEPARLAGTEVVVNVDEVLPTVGEREVAIGDRLRFLLPADWEGRELWRGELGDFEILAEAPEAAPQDPTAG